MKSGREGGRGGHRSPEVNMPCRAASAWCTRHSLHLPLLPGLLETSAEWYIPPLLCKELRTWEGNASSAKGRQGTFAERYPQNRRNLALEHNEHGRTLIVELLIRLVRYRYQYQKFLRSCLKCSIGSTCRTDVITWLAHLPHRQRISRHNSVMLRSFMVGGRKSECEWQNMDAHA